MCKKVSFWYTNFQKYPCHRRGHPPPTPSPCSVTSLPRFAPPPPPLNPGYAIDNQKKKKTRYFHTLPIKSESDQCLGLFLWQVMAYFVKLLASLQKHCFWIFENYIFRSLFTMNVCDMQWNASYHSIICVWWTEKQTIVKCNLAYTHQIMIFFLVRICEKQTNREKILLLMNSHMYMYTVVSQMQRLSN